MNARAQALEQMLTAAARCRALRNHAEDLLGQALTCTDPEQRAELADDALAAVAALQRAEREVA